MDIDNQVNQIVQQVISDITGKIQKQVMDVVSKQITEITSKVDYHALFKSALTTSIEARQFEFPRASVPGNAIDLKDFVISGESVVGGIIKNFGSTGIDDQATNCQLTIMDEVTVVENNLLTKDLTVKGTATIEGDLNVTGSIPESSPLYQQIVKNVTNNVRTSLDKVVFSSYADMVLSQIKQDGLDLTKITVNGDEVINGSNLGTKITSSNLQRVGMLQDLQVQGETILGQTLYTVSKRVGINTIEPGHALSVWDQEIEIGFGKQGTNVAIIEVPRKQTLIISSNGKNNLALTSDGGVTVNQLTLGSMSISCSDRPPSNDQPRGALVFNSNPTLGGPLGWISLGDAKWANFGYVD